MPPPPHSGVSTRTGFTRVARRAGISASIDYVHQAADRWRGSEATVYLSPHDQMPSLGYLLKVDGLVIYYAGFRAEDGEKLRHELDFLADHTDRVDLAFLQRFDPRAVLILSPDRREDLFPEMASRLRGWGFEGEIFTAAAAGDEFVFERVRERP